MIYLNDRPYEQDKDLSQKEAKELEFFLGENLWNKLKRDGYVVLLYPQGRIKINSSKGRIWLSGEMVCK